jgi:hypothetical protein
VVPRTGLDGRKISSPQGFNPGPSSPYSVAIPTELPGPHIITLNSCFNVNFSVNINIFFRHFTGASVGE